MFSDPMDTDPLYGWESISCNVIDTGSGVNEVYLNLTYPDNSETSFLMINSGGSTYNYDTTFSSVGEYSYYIWTVDNLVNDESSSANTFTIYPNWDIDMNGHIYLPDLVQVSLEYGTIGADGWIREDVDNNGEVFLPDLVQVSLHYDEMKLLDESSKISLFQKTEFKRNMDTTVVRISPSSQTVSNGESFTVNIFVDPGEPVNGVAFALSYDASLIHADSVTEGDLFDGFTTFFNPGTIDNVAGTITSVYGLTVPATNTVTDSGVFCTISFTSQSSIGTSSLDLNDVCATDVSGECISDIIVNDGSVSVMDNGANNQPVFSDENPSDGSINLSITMNTLSIFISDPEGDAFDWSIETIPDIGSSSGIGEFNDTKYCDISGLSYGTTYNWYVSAVDPSGSGQTTSEVYTFTTESVVNNPPNKPTITGETNGKRGNSYSYSATTTDPDDDQVFYWFDWDDGTNSGWVGTYDSGQTAVKSHVWNTRGSFSIKVKAKDTNGAESAWSDPLFISMPKNRTFFNFLENHPFLFFILQRLLQIPIFEKLLGL
jgi:hypothetical protein